MDLADYSLHDSIAKEDKRLTLQEKINGVKGLIKTLANF